eukprot:gene11914-13881_t
MSEFFVHLLIPQEDGGKGCVFTGDTLFVGGCGRLFEGNPQQMYHALYNVFGALPDDTLAYVGHEYTTSNLAFAKSLEPNNQELLKKIEWTKEQRDNGLPTVPSTVGGEKQFNPFMRVHLPSISSHFQENLNATPQEVLGYIRGLKDNFKA